MNRYEITKKRCTAVITKILLLKSQNDHRQVIVYLMRREGSRAITVNLGVFLAPLQVA